MLDKFTYTNHLGEVITFGDFPYFANHSDLRDYEWIYDEDVTKFDRGVVTKSLNVIVAGSEVYTTKAKDKLYEIFEKDVLAMKKGTFTVGDYHMNAFVYGSKKSDYLTNKNVLVLELNVVTDTPQWQKEDALRFFANTENVGVDYGRDYDTSRAYPYGYIHNQINTVINNDSFFACGFKLIIFGAASNPAIMIGDNLYRVDVEVAKGEHLEIISNGSEKTIKLHKNNGTVEDCFAKRYKPQSVFAKIEAGYNTVTWDNSFGFILTLLKERSEPKWTL